MYASQQLLRRACEQIERLLSWEGPLTRNQKQSICQRIGCNACCLAIITQDEFPQMVYQFLKPLGPWAYQFYIASRVFIKMREQPMPVSFVGTLTQEYADTGQVSIFLFFSCNDLKPVSSESNLYYCQRYQTRPQRCRQHKCFICKDTNSQEINLPQTREDWQQAQLLLQQAIEFTERFFTWQKAEELRENPEEYLLAAATNCFKGKNPPLLLMYNLYKAYQLASPAFEEKLFPLIKPYLPINANCSGPP